MRGRLCRRAAFLGDGAQAGQAHDAKQPRAAPVPRLRVLLRPHAVQSSHSWRHDGARRRNGSGGNPSRAVGGPARDIGRACSPGPVLRRRRHHRLRRQQPQHGGRRDLRRLRRISAGDHRRIGRVPAPCRGGRPRGLCRNQRLGPLRRLRAWGSTDAFPRRRGNAALRTLSAVDRCPRDHARASHGRRRRGTHRNRRGRCLSAELEPGPADRFALAMRRSARRRRRGAARQPYPVGRARRADGAQPARAVGHGHGLGRVVLEGFCGRGRARRHRPRIRACRAAPPRTGRSAAPLRRMDRAHARLRTALHA